MLTERKPEHPSGISKAHNRETLPNPQAILENPVALQVHDLDADLPGDASA
jgi:hypothetical protein